MKPRAVVVLSLIGISTVAPSARAAGRTLEAIPMTGSKLRVDGDLREWPGKM